MKFAFIIMGNFNMDKDHTTIHNGEASMIGVANIDEACTVAKQLQNDGVNCIELCGAFEEDGAKRIIEATNNKIPVGYVIHLPQQDDLFNALFSK